MSEISNVSGEQALHTGSPTGKNPAGRGGAARARAAGPEAAGSLEARVRAVNRQFASLGVHLRFHLSRDDREVVILVIDEQTGDVVKTVPPDYFMRATGGAPQAAGQGLLVDEGF